jgi:hypothetical protein
MDSSVSGGQREHPGIRWITDRITDLVHGHQTFAGPFHGQSYPAGHLIFPVMADGQKFRWWIPGVGGWVLLLLVIPGIALALGVLAVLVLAAEGAATRRGISVRGVLSYKIRKILGR